MGLGNTFFITLYSLCTDEAISVKKVSTYSAASPGLRLLNIKNNYQFPGNWPTITRPCLPSCRVGPFFIASETVGVEEHFQLGDVLSHTRTSSIKFKEYLYAVLEMDILAH